MKTIIGRSYQLGITCINSYFMNKPFLMHSWIKAESFEKAKEIFMNDPTVRANKTNDIVMLLAMKSVIKS